MPTVLVKLVRLVRMFLEGNSRWPTAVWIVVESYGRRCRRKVRRSWHEWRVIRSGLLQSRQGRRFGELWLLRLAQLARPNHDGCYTRMRERQMRRFKSSRQAQRFPSLHGVVRNLFCIARHLLRSTHHRLLRSRSFEVWRTVRRPNDFEFPFSDQPKLVPISLS